MNSQSTLHTVRNVFMLVFFGLLLGGCLSNNTKPANYYLLTADKSLDVISLQQDKKPAIVIRGIHIPDYLDRKQIVTRNSSHGLMVSEQHRWGGRFRKNIERVLANNLSFYLSGASVVVTPHSQPITPTYLLEISIHEFERLENGLVMLSADWHLIDPDNQKSVSFGQENIASENVISENDYHAIVASMSRALDQLGHKIAYAVSQQTY